MLFRFPDARDAGRARSIACRSACMAPYDYAATPTASSATELPVARARVSTYCRRTGDEVFDAALILDGDGESGTVHRSGRTVASFDRDADRLADGDRRTVHVANRGTATRASLEPLVGHLAVLDAERRAGRAGGNAAQWARVLGPAGRRESTSSPQSSEPRRSTRIGCRDQLKPTVRRCPRVCRIRCSHPVKLSRMFAKPVDCPTSDRLA